MTITRPRVRRQVLVAAAVFTLTALGAAPASADEVPEEWGEPSAAFGYVAVAGRQDGYLPGRRGNQHVVAALTDEEDILRGEVNDWRCPEGVTAPVWRSEATTCRIKGSYDVAFDYDAVSPVAHSWAPDLRYMALRVPVTVSSTDGTTGWSGTLSLRVRATGASNLEVYDADGLRESWLDRQDAYVVGGKFTGLPWLEMTSVEVLDNEIGVYSYYYGPAT